jgi:hypothetical protein
MRLWGATRHSPIREMTDRCELETFSFGDSPALADELAALVLTGIKIAMGGHREHAYPRRHCSGSPGRCPGERGLGFEIEQPIFEMTTRNTASLDAPIPPEPVAALRAQVEKSALNIYDVPAATGRHGMLLGWKRWRE